MASGGNDSLSDEVFNFKCSTCVKQSKHREAVKYCVECQGYCCQSCVDMHCVFPTLVNHNLLDKSSFQSTVCTADLPEVPTVRCGQHEIKVLDMYCGNHDILGCTTCMSLDHRSCNDVQSITDSLDTIFKKTDADKTHKNLIEMKAKMDEIKKSREDLQLQLQKSKTEAVNAIKEFRKEMESLLKSIEKESIKEVEKMFHEIESNLNKEKKKAEDESESVRRAADDLQRTEGNRAQLFVYMKTSQKIIAESESVYSLLQKPTEAKITFSANPRIRDFLHQMQTFGTVTSHSEAIFALTPRKTLYSVNGVREMNVKSQNDRYTCLVYGSCFTDDGLLLLADNLNYKVKVADIVKMSLVDVCDMPGAPRGVCYTSKQEVAVTLNNKTVQFVSLGNRLTCTRQMKLDHNCFGVAYKDSRLYITDGAKTLYIHDLTGTLVQTVSKDSSGNELFQNCRHIAFSVYDNKLLVADSAGLYKFDSNGKHVDTFKDVFLKNGFGVCTDRKGNTFVCGHNSHNVIQIAQDGNKKLGVLVRNSDGVKNPYSVSFDPGQCALVVTQFNDNIIKLFDLQ